MDETISAIDTEGSIPAALRVSATQSGGESAALTMGVVFYFLPLVPLPPAL
jgi:hypothetical protein